MNNFIETETSISVVTIVGIKSEPPAVTIVHSGKDARGLRRDFVQQVPVRGAELARRVLSELHKDDRIQATVVNEWREGGCDTYLADFQKFADTKAEVGTTNGGMSIAKSEIADIVTSPVQRTKTSVRH